MSDQEEVLAREVAITAKVDETGVSLKSKSRAVAALDRLIGSIADWPAAFFEGRADKRRAKDQIEKRLMEVRAEVAARKLSGLEQAGDEFLIRVLNNEGRKQANVAAVAIEAMEELKALPPPGEPNQTKPVDGPEEIDDDWMNQFTRYAEDASSDQLQHLWGRVLAGEINRPGAFSRHTLRFIAELDKTTAENCEFAAEWAIDDFIPKTADWAESKHLMVGLDLQRLGILEGVTGMGGMQKTFQMPEGPKYFTKEQKIVLVSGQVDAKVTIPAIIVTRLAREVFSLLKPADPTKALRELATLLQEQQAVDRIELGSWVPEGEGLRYFLEELVFTRQQQATPEG